MVIANAANPILCSVKCAFARDINIIIIHICVIVNYIEFSSLAALAPRKLLAINLKCENSLNACVTILIRQSFKECE